VAFKPFYELIETANLVKGQVLGEYVKNPLFTHDYDQMEANVA
jgi:hypothetical protein